LAEAGFKTIRVPVTWYPHLDKDNQIDPEWMNRVEEVVNYVLDEGMYCVLNVHHDAGEAKSCWLRADLERYDEINTRFVAIWQQIATRFNKYGEHLVFEGWGEIIDKYDVWNCPKDTTAFEAINRLAQSFVNTVRATGGNNAQRNLMLCTYSASVGGWYAHDGETGQSDLALSEFKLPKDNVEDHLIASVHSYIPWNWDQNHSKLSEANIAEIKQTFEKFDKYFISRGIPLVIGEYAALFVDGTYAQEGEITEEDQEEGAKYTRLMVEEATKRDISLLYFMGLIDKEDRVKLQWSRPKTVQAIIDTYHKYKK
jgi:endoglucanase